MKEFLDDLIMGGEVDRAVKVAYEYFHGRKDLESFTYLCNALVTARRIRELEGLYKRFPHLFRKKVDTLAVLLFRTLRLKELFNVLSRSPVRVRAWILSSLGYVERAYRELDKMEDKSIFLKFYLDTLSGNVRSGKFRNPFDRFMSRIYYDYLLGTLWVTAGMLEEGLNLLNSVAFRSFEGGYVGWGIDTILLKGFVGLNPTEIEAGRYIAQHLGDNFSVMLADIYLSLFRGSVPDVPDIPRFTLQRRYAEAVLRGNPLPDDGILGYKAQWWYVEKFRYRKTFLTLSGRARVMEGMKEVHLERPKRSVPVLIFHRILGSEGKKYAHIIFQTSKDPRRRYEEYLGRLNRLKHVPMDFFIARRYGTFLSKETEPWAEFLKNRVSKGDL